MIKIIKNVYLAPNKLLVKGSTHSNNVFEPTQLVRLIQEGVVEKMPEKRTPVKRTKKEQPVKKLVVESKS